MSTPSSVTRNVNPKLVVRGKKQRKKHGVHDACRRAKGTELTHAHTHTYTSEKRKSDSER